MCDEKNNLQIHVTQYYYVYRNNLFLHNLVGIQYWCNYSSILSYNSHNIKICHRYSSYIVGIIDCIFFINIVCIYYNILYIHIIYWSYSVINPCNRRSIQDCWKDTQTILGTVVSKFAVKKDVCLDEHQNLQSNKQLGIGTIIYFRSHL